MSATITTIVANPWLKAARDAFEEAGAGIEPCGADAFAFTTKNGVMVRGGARLQPDWLLLRAPCSEAMHKVQEESPEGALALIERNATLRGGVRFGIGDGGRPGLFAEIPLTRGLDLRSPVARALEGIRQAWHEQRAAVSCAAPLEGDAETIDWAKLCAEAGWQSAPRATGDVAVEVGRARCSERVLLTCGSPPRAQWRFHAPEGVDPACRAAAGSLLLAASGLVRLVRPVTTDEGVGFEHQWEDRPQSFLLGRVLEALTVAAGLCGGPLLALSSPRVASAFLRRRGWSPEAGQARGSNRVREEVISWQQKL